jgi:hypothetical protein
MNRILCLTCDAEQTSTDLEAGFCTQCKTPAPAAERKVLDAVGVSAAIGVAIKTLGEVPAGHLYARVMAHLTLDQFNSAIARLEHAKVVRRRRDHMLVWTGGAQ